MMINDVFFEAFIKCETKFHLLKKGHERERNEYDEWQRLLFEDYKKSRSRKITKDLRNNQFDCGLKFPNELNPKHIQVALEPCIEVSNIKTVLHAIRVATISRRKNYIPIRFSLNNKISKDEKLLVAFDALAMSKATGKVPPWGEIIHGEKFVKSRVKIKVQFDNATEILKRISQERETPTPPDIILNKHCAECLFNKKCFKIAKEKDDLSLISHMITKERDKLRNRGIFTVTALSYTFRPRKPRKKTTAIDIKFNIALKALAIREKKIYVTGSPKVNLTGTSVYLDIEGIPDKDFYYLVGVRINSNNTISQYSFWANSRHEEQTIWCQLYRLLLDLDDPQIYYYGNYEAKFFQQMKSRYPQTIQDLEKLDKIISKSTNILKTIYGQIYFPTFSNTLKEIGNYLQYRWSESDSSGAISIMWRSKWRLKNDNSFKRKLLKYNLEDCEALEIVTNTIYQIIQNNYTQSGSYIDTNSVHTDSLKPKSLYHWGESLISPEFNHINKCSYWDYQRNRVYIKSNPSLKRAIKKTKRKKLGPLKINKVIEPSIPLHCPNCQAVPVYKYAYKSKILYDLKFTKNGVKRWVEKYHTVRYHCRQCEIIFPSDIWFQTKHRYGWGLISFIIYHIIEMSVPQAAVARIINQLFGYSIHSGRISHLKTRASDYYLETYESIKNKLFNGEVIYADETRANVDGTTAYVWVFTSLTEVAYLFSETREGIILKDHLHNFRGVLVSDFYSAYDSIDCAQQKCLIHLIRDFNKDTLKHPFDDDLHAVSQEFASLLKTIVETIDRFGLKKYYLNKHKKDVNRFYKHLNRRSFETDIVLKYKKRLNKYRDKLFTFLGYNNVAWNNNNAEHAIKAFARLRRVLGGNTNSKGIQEYLVLLSVYQTCKYNEINFFDLLRSGRKKIHTFDYDL